MRDPGPNAKRWCVQWRKSSSDPKRTAMSAGRAAGGKTPDNFGRSSRSSVRFSATKTGRRSIALPRSRMARVEQTEAQANPAYSYLIRQVEAGAFGRSGMQISAGGGNRSVAQGRLHQVNRRAAVERVAG